MSPQLPQPVFCRLSEAGLQDLVEIEAESNRPPWNAALFAREFTNRYSGIYGARFEGKLAGFLVCHSVLDEAHIVNFGVRVSMRGRGVGRTILENVLECLNQEGIRWVTLEVRRSNQVALKLYSSIGFIESGIREKYYSDNGEDGLLLKLNLRDFAARRLSEPAPLRSVG